jgi:hypothetical protein
MNVVMPDLCLKGQLEVSQMKEKGIMGRGNSMDKGKV